MGVYIDNPYMSSGRSDLSFTLSLTNKDFYKGGELIIETMNTEEIQIKLERSFYIQALTCMQ